MHFIMLLLLLLFLLFLSQLLQQPKRRSLRERVKLNIQSGASEKERMIKQASEQVEQQSGEILDMIG
jgi:hypothetical protein